MTDEHVMPQYDGMEYENLVTAAQFLWMENAKLREQIHWLKKGDVLHVLTDHELADQQKHEREMQASIDAMNADNNMLREMLSESRQANEYIFTELKRYNAEQWRDYVKFRDLVFRELKIEGD